VTRSYNHGNQLRAFTENLTNQPSIRFSEITLLRGFTYLLTMNSWL